MEFYKNLSSDALRRYLENTRRGIELGIQPGRLREKRAQEFRLELIRRGEPLR